MIYLYDGPVPIFAKLARTPRFASQLEEEFQKRFGQNTSVKEVESWANSLSALAMILEDNDFKEAHILLEFKMPICSARCDVIVTGKSAEGVQRAVVIELKQWQYAAVSAIRDFVTIGGKNRSHPSAQVRQYCEYLRYYHHAFSSDDVKISGCSFLHNLQDKKSINLLNDPALFSLLPKEFPVFTNKNTVELKKYLKTRIGYGMGEDIAKKLIHGRIQPSTKLLDVVAEVINQDFEWRLIDEQLLAFNTVVSMVESLKELPSKGVILMRGGPGTGKSVLAIQLLAYAARQHWRVAHSTGSKAFQIVLGAKTQHLADQFLKDTFGVRYKTQLPVGRLFSTFANIAQVGAKTSDEFDLVVGDEAHRLWDYRRRKFQGMNKQLSNTPMIEELINAAKVTALFLDDNQSVRANEIGTIEYITRHVENLGYKVEVIDLITQFRCLGSRSYLDWVDAVLGFSSKRSLSWKQFDGYDFRIMSSMQQMQASLDAFKEEGYTGRIVAGFCWKWSNPQGHGGLIDDVADARFGGWSAPWIEKTDQNARPTEHRYYKWATDSSYANQIGSIYSIQGFEFDHIGIIFGEDLVIRDGKWVSNLDKNKDNTFKTEIRNSAADATEKLRNTYRVLLTRGMQGSFVFFLDDETRDYFEKMLT